MAVSYRRGLGCGSPAEWGPRLLLLVLLGGCSGRIHRLALTGEKRADIQLNSFGFYTNGSLEVELSLLRLGLPETEEKHPQVGFSLSRVRSGSIRSYSNRGPHECPLGKNSSNFLVLFLINTKDLQVQVRKYGEQKKLFISPGLLPEAPPKPAHTATPKGDVGTTTAKKDVQPGTSPGSQQGTSQEDKELVLGPGPPQQLLQLQLPRGDRLEGRGRPVQPQLPQLLQLDAGTGAAVRHHGDDPGEEPGGLPVGGGNSPFQALPGHVRLLSGRRHLLGVCSLQEHVQRLQDPLAHGGPGFHQEHLPPLPQHQLLLHQQPGPPHRGPRCHALHHTPAEGRPPLHHHRPDRLRLGLRQVRAVRQGEEDLRDRDPPAGPGQRGLHRYRVPRGGSQRLWPLEGDPLPGGPHLLWRHPLPRRLVHPASPGRVWH
ncbi:protein GPR108 isoform X2 [Dasypus novemcinctus]|uniref:protein GPR108 isoform X2 n=1 Tax=Dasypus novemcinctus TaxID=9361 RepID=UPI0039C8CEA9